MPLLAHVFPTQNLELKFCKALKMEKISTFTLFSCNLDGYFSLDMSFQES
jgi:hypothetical protein